MATADETSAFTEQELKVTLGLCLGLSSKAIAEQCGITEDMVRHGWTSAYDKAGVSSRLELYEFVKAALNVELRRRRTGNLKKE